MSKNSEYIYYEKLSEHASDILVDKKGIFLKAAENLLIPPHQTISVKTDLKITLPEDTIAIILSSATNEKQCGYYTQCPDIVSPIFIVSSKNSSSTPSDSGITVKLYSSCTKGSNILMVGTVIARILFIKTDNFGIIHP